MIRRLNPFFRNSKTEKHVPRFPGVMPNSPGLGAPVNPLLNVPDASGQVGPVFAQGAQGSFGLQAVDVVLSSAQILALLGTPISLLPALPVGFRYIFVGAKIVFTGGSVAYTDAGGAVQFKVGASAIAALASNAIFLVTVSPNRRIQWFDNGGETDTAGNPPDSDGAALTITKITNNFAAGNGTAKITVYYVIEPTT
jgi:hypothetical protein